MKIHKNGEQTIIIWDAGKHPFEEFSTWAQGYLEQQKQKLSREELAILNAEEAVSDLPAEEPYKWRAGSGWSWSFNTIKDGKLQDFLLDLHIILDLFYKRVINHIEEINDKGITEKILERVEIRKQELTASILKTIEDFQLYSLTTTYYDSEKKGNVSYKCAPLTSIELNRWKKTYITHIFNPELDMNIISNVWSSTGWWENTYFVSISKDVFTWSTKDKKKNSNYLAQQLWYNTKEELFKALKDNNLNDKWKEALFLGQKIKRLRDDTN